MIKKKWKYRRKKDIQKEIKKNWSFQISLLLRVNETFRRFYEEKTHANQEMTKIVK